MKKTRKKNKFKRVNHTSSKKRLFNPKVAKKTIELFYTPSKNNLLSKK